MPDQKDKAVWFITGCSAGFGRELAVLLLQKGLNVVITARDITKVKALTQGYDDSSLVLPLDVTDKKQIGSAVARARDRFGKIDVLVNNAGYGYFTSVEEGEEEKIRQQFETNFFGLVSLIQEVLPGMRDRRSGSIVNVSSIGGLRSFTSTGFYHATKFALEGLSESLQQEVAPLGIKVLIVEPGPFRTDWAGRSRIDTPTKFEDYRETVGKRMETSLASSGKQKGDPVRGCEAIIEAVENGSPHLRLLLGKIAYDMAIEKTEILRDNFLAWKELSLGADYPDEQQ